MGCCKTPKYTFSATLVGFVGIDWQKSGLNRKKRNPCFFATLDPHKNNFKFFYHHRKSEVHTDIFCVESLFPMCLV